MFTITQESVFTIAGIRTDEPDAPEVDVWLRDFLTHGPKTAKELFAAGREDGYSRDQLKRAKERIGVTSGKQAFAGPWSWILPAGTFSEECGVSPNKKQVLPSHPSLEAAPDKGFSDCALGTSDAPLRSSPETSNHGGCSDFETRRERRAHVSHRVEQPAPLAGDWEVF